MRIAIVLSLVLATSGCAQVSSNPASAPTVPPTVTSESPTAQRRAEPTSSGRTSAPTTGSAAPTTGPAAPTTGPAALASIRGKVTGLSARGETAVANTAVELRPEVPRDASDSPRASTHTDPNGQYALERIENGRYLLSAGGGGAGSPQANVTIAGVDQTLDLQLEPVALALVFSQFSGRVVDATDKPAAAASVWEAEGNCHATTAADGSYKFVLPSDGGHVRRLLNATTPARSGFVLATDTSPQPTIRLDRPALSAVPAAACQTSCRAASSLVAQSARRKPTA